MSSPVCGGQGSTRGIPGWILSESGEGDLGYKTDRDTEHVKLDNLCQGEQGHGGRESSSSKPGPIFFPKLHSGQMLVF